MKKTTIIAGDFNAHNTAWNCHSTDSNGEFLMEIMEDHGYICLNTDTLTRMGDNNQRASNIDLILCTHDVPDIMDY